MRRFSVFSSSGHWLKIEDATEKSLRKLFLIDIQVNFRI